jgi:ABC-2 type transport system ATP-binding protein
MNEYTIAVNHITKIYKGVEYDKKESGLGLWIKNIFRLTSNKSRNIKALDDVTFRVKKGEIFGIFGSNGAGKTTIVKTLSGLLYPDQGEVVVNNSKGNDVKNNISYISTNGWMGLEWQLTAKENLILYGNMFGSYGKILDRKCDEILHSLDMYSDKDKFISQLSAGMRQKITIARGLIIEKPIIYFDESNVSLDVNSSKKLRSLIKEYTKSKEKTVIITSHNPRDLEICDRVMFLNKGKVVAIGRDDELRMPFQAIKTIVVKCPYFDIAMLDELRNIESIVSVITETLEGKRDYQTIKINIRDNQITMNDLIDFLIEKEIVILDMRVQETSLQEIYEYYVGDGFNG